MSVYNKNNKFVSYLIILVSLFVLVLVTKDQVMFMQENLDLRDMNNVELSEKKTKLSELNNLKAELVNTSENISKYNVSIKEDEIIDYIYSYIEETNNKDGIATVKSISISDAVDTEM
jgi:Tfp pilus assembly protein PilO